VEGGHRGRGEGIVVFIMSGLAGQDVITACNNYCLDLWCLSTGCFGWEVGWEGQRDL